MIQSSKIFCAIDTADLALACDLAKKVGPVTGAIKLGLEFYNALGPMGIECVQKAAGDADLFIDLKFHDIPNTVAGAVRSVCNNFAPAYLNVHASGGLEMMEAALDACHPDTRLLAVTLLTSLDEDAVEAVGYNGGIRKSVERLALLTKEAALDGIVCSALEIETIRSVCGDDFDLMVPGIRPKGAVQGDQKRIMTPKQALDTGATHLVIGRPITGADDPAKAAQDILESL